MTGLVGVFEVDGVVFKGNPEWVAAIVVNGIKKVVSTLKGLRYFGESGWLRGTPRHLGISASRHLGCAR
jgi:hypothetical protein